MTTAPPSRWPDVRDWRKATRAKLLPERRALSRHDKNRCTAAITQSLHDFKAAFAQKRVEFGESGMTSGLYVHYCFPLIPAAAFCATLAGL